MNRRRLLALGAAVALLASVAGTGGFGSVNADRSVRVAVVDDDEAYLGIEGDDASDGTWNVSLTNRLASGATLHVEVAIGDQRATATLDAGESESVTLTGVDCGATATVTAEGMDHSVTIEASREVPCDGTPGTPTPTPTPTGSETTETPS